VAHCAAAAPYVGAAAARGAPQGWSRVDDVEDTSRLFASSWEARAAAAMLAWYMATEQGEGEGEGEGEGGGEGQEHAEAEGEGKEEGLGEGQRTTADGEVLGSTLGGGGGEVRRRQTIGGGGGGGGGSALDATLRVVGVSEASLPVRAMMSLRRAAAAGAAGAAGGAVLDPVLRRNLLVDV